MCLYAISVFRAKLGGGGVGGERRCVVYQLTMLRRRSLANNVWGIIYLPSSAIYYPIQENIHFQLTGYTISDLAIYCNCRGMSVCNGVSCKIFQMNNFEFRFRITPSIPINHLLYRPMGSYDSSPRFLDFHINLWMWLTQCLQPILSITVNRYDSIM